MKKSKNPQPDGSIYLKALISSLLQEESYIHCSCPDNDYRSCMCDTGPAIKTEVIERILGKYRNHKLVATDPPDNGDT